MRLPVHLKPNPRRWSLRDRPGFPEAYPMFGIGEAIRELRHGRDHLLWRDHRGIISGAARVGRDRDLGDTMVLTYTVEERDYLDQAAGDLTLPLVWKGSQADNRRPFAPCPLCARSVDTLVFTGAWCCVSIHHGLRHRSAVVAQEIRWTEELEEIDGALAAAMAGRPSARQVARRGALLAKLGDRRVDANALQRVRMTRQWVQPIAVEDIG